MPRGRRKTRRIGPNPATRGASDSMDEEPETLRRMLRKRRAEQDLSLRQVADQTGISAATLYRIENGIVSIGVRTGWKISRFLRIPMGRNGGSRMAGEKRGRKHIFTPAQKNVLARMIREALKAELRGIARAL